MSPESAMYQTQPEEYAEMALSKIKDSVNLFITDYLNSQIGKVKGPERLVG